VFDTREEAKPFLFEHRDLLQPTAPPDHSGTWDPGRVRRHLHLMNVENPCRRKRVKHIQGRSVAMARRGVVISVGLHSVDPMDVGHLGIQVDGRVAIIVRRRCEMSWKMGGWGATDSALYP
jgi:hypothetical protein